MKKTRCKTVLSALLALTLCLSCLTGCGMPGLANMLPNPGPSESNAPAGAPDAPSDNDIFPEGGVLCLKVNPEIAIAYDADGLVTGVTARNADAEALLEGYTGYEGRACRTVTAELVTRIGAAGYFVEEVEGSARQITIEIETGSKLPSDTFLDDVVAEVRTAVNTNDWTSPVDVKGESDYGITDYVDTDYGPYGDGNTDYNDTDYGPNGDGVTDYDNNVNDNTDYGEGNDGVTDFDDHDGTDYGPNGDGNTDYNDTDYGVYGDGVTDYDNNINDATDYGEGSDGVTDFDDHDGTDYGPNGDGNTDYNDTDYGKYGDGVTDYSGSSNYGSSGYSNYDSGYDG